MKKQDGKYKVKFPLLDLNTQEQLFSTGRRGWAV